VAVVNAEPAPVTDAKGETHFTISYPYANTVGCSCGWTRRFVAPQVHDEVIQQHLDKVRK
jgi:hypothetical protein